MSLKKRPVVAYVLIGIVVILAFTTYNGCRQSKKSIVSYNALSANNDSLRTALSESKAISDSSKIKFQDTLEFERGQRALVEAQKERTEIALGEMDKKVKDLLVKHKMAQYTDTSAVLVPSEYITDCEGCFTKLEDQNNLVKRYRHDINTLQDNWDRQNKIYQNRFKELDAEKLRFYNKINSLVKQQQQYMNNLKPHGRLYLSWGVLWKPWPWAAGGGLLYQTKYNVIYGAKYYYSGQGALIETTINFPLSIKFK